MAQLPEGFRVVKTPESKPQGSGLPEGFSVVPPSEPPKPQPPSNFQQAFTAYRRGEMAPEKIPAFEELLRRKMPQVFHEGGFMSGIAPGDTAEKAARAFPGSLAEELTGAAQALASPVETAKGVGKTLMGGMSKLAGDYPSKTEADVEAEGYWDAMVDDFVSKYGSFEGFVNAVETRPANVLFDLAGILTAGGAATAKVPGMQRASQVMTEIGKGLDPVQVAGQAVKPVAQTAARAGAKTVEEGLGITTGVGGNVIREAKGTQRSVFDTAREKMTGAPREGAGFEEARSGKLTPGAIANQAKAAVADVKEQRRQAFVSRLDELEQADVNISMDQVNETLVDQMEKLKAKPVEGKKGLGFDLSRVSPNKGDRGKIQDVIDRVMNHGTQPGDLTPTGMLELREYLDEVSTGNPKIKEFTQSLKSSIDETLGEIPGYENLRTEIDTYDALINEFEGTLGLGPEKSGQEVIRKLVSVSEEDIGLRRRLLAELESMTDTSLAQEIAGLEMQRTLPKAMISRAAGGAMLMGGMVTSMPLLSSLAAVSSPRLMGKLLSTYGYSRNTVKQVVNSLKKAGAFDQKVTTGAAIAGRTDEEETE